MTPLVQPSRQVTFLLHWPMLLDIAVDYRRYLVVSDDTIISDDTWLTKFNTLLNQSMDPATIDYLNNDLVYDIGIDAYIELFDQRLCQVFDWYRVPDNMFDRIISLELMDNIGSVKLVVDRYD